ncbi:single-stranded DNA-binding protein [Alicyclobacillus tolerans]|uniref:Single-stranded DNA-binding protein n=1 Tax=Alicyclobacillus tolerans TaxID=90970 RepID=A0A1M6WPP0_9BACL|nr:single-stranded DNA-binding protein [Alicyclobacillus montanus]SHK95658.1 single-strand binding protein [Alicyclobacillus montanus]
MLNRVILIGRLTADPELRYTHSGTAVGGFTLAVDRPRTNQHGERETDFIQIVVWQKQAEVIAQYLKKGRMAAVDGRLQTRSYENKDGQKVRVAEIVAESVRFLDSGHRDVSPRTNSAVSPKNTSPKQSTGASYGDDPFGDDPFGDDLPDLGDDMPF